MPMKARYTVIDGEIIAEKRGGVRSLYVPDPLGSTRGLINNAQTQTDTFSYWPYGESQSRIGTTGTPFQFVGTKGYYHSSKTYVRARNLDVAKGRWLIKDPIGLMGGDNNVYRYSANNPTTISDPTGLDWVSCVSDCIEQNDPWNLVDKGLALCLGGRIPKSFGPALGIRTTRTAEASRWMTIPSAVSQRLGLGAKNALRSVGRVSDVILIVYGNTLAAVEIYCFISCANPPPQPPWQLPTHTAPV